MDTEVGENLQMLLSLRHPSVVGCNNNQRHINGPDTREHVFHEVFVARNANDSNQKRRSSWRGGGKFQVSETEIDGDAARFLFGQTVGISAGKRFDNCAFSMIDVTGGRDNKMLILFHRKAERTAARISAS